MVTDLSALPDNTEKLKNLVAELVREKERLERTNEILCDEVELWKHKVFGRSSEKLTEEEKHQMRLFDEAEEGGGDRTVG